MKDCKITRKIANFKSIKLSHFPSIWCHPHRIVYSKSSFPFQFYSPPVIIDGPTCSPCQSLLFFIPSTNAFLRLVEKVKAIFDKGEQPTQTALIISDDIYGLKTKLSPSSLSRKLSGFWLPNNDCNLIFLWLLCKLNYTCLKRAFFASLFLF